MYLHNEQWGNHHSLVRCVKKTHEPCISHIPPRLPGAGETRRPFRQEPSSQERDSGERAPESATYLLAEGLGPSPALRVSANESKISSVTVATLRPGNESARAQTAAGRCREVPAVAS